MANMTVCAMGPWNQREYDALLAEARAARGLPRAEWANLRGYLVHGSRCAWKRSGPCDCGLVAALRAFLRAARHAHADTAEARAARGA